jgi:4-nitrophenyl phosphatase
MNPNNKQPSQMRSNISQLSPAPLGLILDMDGVLWQENSPIGNLPEIFSRIKSLGLRVILATNNSTRTVDQYLRRLEGFGVTLESWQVVTSSLAVAELLSRRFPEKGDVFVIGEDGIRQALTEKGFSVVQAGAAKNAIAVVSGIDREINFTKLREATLLIRRGLPFYGTNADLTFPTPEGLIPGAGSFLALLTAASGVNPIVAGKPEPFILELALERLATPRERTLAVGDRLETDIAGGQAIGCPTALVLSGVSTAEMGEAWKPQLDIIAQDLTGLLA